jgi:hypothetical protein
MPTERRSFLRSASVAAAGMALPCDHAAEAQSPPEPAPSRPAAEPARTLPTVKIGEHQISRLIVGGNPFYGYSHFNRLFSRHMVEWATPDRVCDTLRQCQAEGINTWQISHVDRAIADLKRHRAEGGRLQWILLSHAEIENDHRLIGEAAKLAPVGMVHHGGSAERKRRGGRIQEVKDFLKAVRQSGVMVGLSTHDPEFLEQAESENWDVDFYMTALYYLTRPPAEFEKILGQRPLGEIYLPADPPRMFRAIRQCRRPCLAYKVLAAGRLTDTPQQVEQAFRTAYQGIKPSDAIIVGMYPKYADQVKENAELVRRILRS